MNTTASWLRTQWQNPHDIFTILMIVGGDIVRVAIAQLCCGPVPHLTPVSFSFGWVAYAVTAALSAAGENRLMPPSEVDCLLINVRSGYRRRNRSWLLSRLLRDLEFWQGRKCAEDADEVLQELRRQNAARPRPKPQDDVRVALRVTVWNCVSSTGVGRGDWVYWIGLIVTTVQLGVAAIPWGLYNQWLTFFITIIGTFFAYWSAGLSQWAEEKIGVRGSKISPYVTKRKDVFLTEGNGSPDALLILSCEGGMDLEALAAPQRELRHPMQTRVNCIALAALWILFLITATGNYKNSWYLVGIGMLGALHNIMVAGAPRQPRAFGLDLQYVETIAAGKVMEVLWRAEDSYPGAGAALVPEFFPGKLSDREKLLWDYAFRRKEQYEAVQEAQQNAKEHAMVTEKPTLSRLPALRRPEGRMDDSDIPR